MARRSLQLDRSLDLARTLFPLRRGTGDPTMRIERRSATRATRTPDGPATVQLDHEGDTLAVEAWGAGAEWALEHLDGLIGETDDVSSFDPGDSVVRDLHRRNPGLRITRSGAVFQALVATILEQKIVGADARQNYARLVRALAEPAPGPADLLLPPAAPRLAETPSWTFHRCGVEPRMAATVVHCAQRAGRIEEALAMDADAARARLLALRGVGEWTAAEVALVALGDADAVPVGDYHLPNVVAHALAGEARGDDTRMLELLEPFRGHRGRVIRLLMSGHAGPPRRGPAAPRRDISRL
jgi:3-methyladenine DNA glycosylase/8-oxoguanine DNA glycosylase